MADVGPQQTRASGGRAEARQTCAGRGVRRTGFFSFLNFLGV
jgi:hypothetical protein